MLDLLECLWFFTRPAELSALSSPYARGGTGGLLAVHLDHPKKEVLGPIWLMVVVVCEVSLSQSPVPASDIDVFCSYHGAAVLGSPRQFPKAEFVGSAPLYAKHVLVLICLVIEVLGCLCKMTCVSSYRCIQ